MRDSIVTRLFAMATVLSTATTTGLTDNPPYVKQCSRQDPELKQCLIGALHHLRPFLRDGIPEIELPAVEPFRIDELSLSLIGGENGYKIRLRELDVRGTSNFTVHDIKLGSSFRALITIPVLLLDALYSSSGVLIILPASGNGTFTAKLRGVEALVSGFVSTSVKENRTYLHVEELDVGLKVKDIDMKVHRIFNNNRILTQAINLFLRENGQEVLAVMEPELKRKISTIATNIVNQLLLHVPVESFLRP